MVTFESFEQGLQDALNHLYDPAYQVPGTVYLVMGFDPRTASPQRIQAVVMRAIETLVPAPDVPPSARSRRIHEVLACRYLQKLTQDEAAERLGITPRHLRREQALAVATLAMLLWERYRGEPPPQPETDSDDETPEWLSQVRQELNALEKGSKGSVAGVGDTVASMVEVVSPLAARHEITLAVGQVQPGLVAAIHPSKLRQVLVQSLTGLIRNMPSGRVDISAEGTGTLVKISISGSPAPSGDPPDDELVGELLADYEGAIERRTSEGQYTLIITLPAAAQITVLVLDDNADLMHFYRRYVQGTRYHIVPLAEGTRLFEIVQTVVPDIIVLDVMLPDIDGWELLAHLHNHPATRSIPVVLCSVVREEELALALGAALYVPKPVRRREFIQALDQALSQAAAGASGASGNSA